LIKLPPLNIERDEWQEVRLLEEARKYIEDDNKKRVSGIHASDLLDPRLSYFQTISPQPSSERQIYFYLIGKILHHFVLEVINPEIEKTATDHGTKKELGILYSPDEIDKAGYPVELKTNRANFEPTLDNFQSEYSHYLEQLAVYMICENVMTGFLWLLYLNLKDESRRTFPAFRCYKVEMTAEQFKEVEQNIIANRDQLKKAIEERNHRLLPLCRQWKCGTSCIRWSDCQPEHRWPATNKKSWTH